MTQSRSLDMPRSSRDPAALRSALERWLAGRLGGGAEPRIDAMSSTDSNGMSSDTVLFTATWAVDGQRRPQNLVARIAPSLADLPVFPAYDLQMQYDVIGLVSQATSVPVPEPLWCESDESAIGSAFFVMRQVQGRVPPDNLPYTFGDNWLFDASPTEQRELQDSTVDAIAALHEIAEPAAGVPGLVRDEPGASPLRRHVAHTRAWWDSVVADGMSSRLVERGFEWLDAHWPPREGPPVLLWGDSRIGNVIYDGFRPAALLDWEMAGVGPCELDVAWLVAGHIIFNDLAAALGSPGMPAFMRPEDVAGRYEQRRNVRLDDLHWYLAYSALQWAIVFVRTGQRTAHFTGQPLPDDHDKLIFCQSTLDRLLAG